MSFNTRRHAPKAETAVVQRRKAPHYTVTPIGGKEELKVWRAQQVVAELEWQKVKAKRVDRAVEAFMVPVTEPVFEWPILHKPLTLRQRISRWCRRVWDAAFP